MKIKVLMSDPKIYLFLIFVVCCIHSVYMSFQGFSNPISEHHGFRQTQTAISTYYLTKGGPWLAYETPVLGPPWSIPFELPVYQWIIALLNYITNIPIEPIGRIVSLSFYFLSFFPLSLILIHLKTPFSRQLIFFSLLLTSPLYLYWSRTFMIESTAYSLSMCYLACVTRFFDKDKGRYLILGALFAGVGAAVKVTTFYGFALSAAILMLREFYISNQFQLSWKAVQTRLIPILCFFIVPLVIVLLWTRFSDFLKGANPLAADFITSSALTNWNFGSWDLRFDSDAWERFYSHTILNVIGKGEILWSVAPLLLVIRAEFQLRVLISSFLALAIFLTFTNLHVVHDYYPYANAVFVILAIGWCLVGVYDLGGKNRYVALLFLLIILGFFQSSYDKGYYQIQLQNVEGYSNLANHIQTVTQDQDVIIIWGADWSSEIPYYARRRALMDRSNRELNSPEMIKALGNLSNYTIGAAVVCGEEAKDERFLKPRLLYFGFSEKPSAVLSGCAVFSKSSETFEHGVKR